MYCGLQPREHIDGRPIPSENMAVIGQMACHPTKSRIALKESSMCGCGLPNTRFMPN